AMRVGEGWGEGQGEGQGVVEKSIASAIVDKVAHRKNAVVNMVQETGGSGWIVTDEEIQSAIKLMEETKHLLISPNSALSVAGLAKAIQNGWKWTGAVVCVITGK
ncbi:MAG: pyridoxal-phosphate dependent enzyme, partial [Patescibacteria group bacterium]